MAWNEPGNNKNDGNNPWNKKSGGGQQPPDLDEIFRKLKQQFSSIFGSQKSGGGSSGGKNISKGSATIGVSVIIAVAAVLYILSGIYLVQPAEKAAVFRFGKYVKTLDPGPHWIARFIESKKVVNVEEVHRSLHRAHMLTKDENIVSLELSVQYRIGDVEDYLFNIIDPDASLVEVTDSAMRQVVGHSTFNDILTSGRENVRRQIRDEITQILENYGSGLMILDVPMEPAKAPEEVKEAFDDAIKAQEDEVRSINQANAYAKKNVPIAEGLAQRKLSEGQAYKEQVVLQSEGDVAKFLRILPEYEKAPKVTRERMYLDAMQTILSSTSKVLIDPNSNNNNLLYLPLDKMGRDVSVNNDLIKNEGSDDGTNRYSDSGKRVAANKWDNTGRTREAHQR